MENNIEQDGQRPSARATHHLGQNTLVALAKPAAPTRYRTYDTLLIGITTMGTSFFSEQVIRKQYGYRTATPFVVAPLLSPTLALADQVILKNYRYFHAMQSPPLVSAWKRQNVPIVGACVITHLVITPPGNCMEASKGVNGRGLRYHPPCYHTRCGTGGRLGVPNTSHRIAITPPLRYHKHDE